MKETDLMSIHISKAENGYILNLSKPIQALPGSGESFWKTTLVATNIEKVLQLIEAEMDKSS